MASRIVRELRDGVKCLLHKGGVLSAYHHLRNHRWLTTLIFHRVLPPSDPRFPDADREWTITVDQLVDCVVFAKRYFNIVSLDAVLDARRRGKALPPRPLLLTFDDGWADSEEYALPVLEAERVPGVIFVTSDVVGTRVPFWFEVLRQARIGGRIDDATWTGLWSSIDRSSPGSRGERDVEQLIEHLSALPRVRRDEILAPYRRSLEDGHRHMLTVEQLKRLDAKNISVGAHGRTHQPLSRCEDLEDELREPRRRLEELLGHPVTTLALPHSRFTQDVLRRAEAAGYELVFTGEPELSPSKRIPFSIGRTAITPDGLADERGRLRHDELALQLFRKRHLTVDGPARKERLA